MEQNNERETTEKEPKAEIPFWNRPSGGGLVLLGIILIIVGYFAVWVPRQECANEVNYHPAGTVKTSMNGLGSNAEAVTNSEGYYSYGYSYNEKKFPTKSQAVNYCVSQK